MYSSICIVIAPYVTTAVYTSEVLAVQVIDKALMYVVLYLPVVDARLCGCNGML